VGIDYNGKSTSKYGICVSMKLELLVSRYKRMIGLARYTSELRKHLSQGGVDFSVVEPALPPLLKAADCVLRPLGYDLGTFLNVYPVSAPLSRDAVKHFTTQMMGSLFSFQPGLKKVVVTVCDIVPYMMRDDPQQNVYHGYYERWFDGLAMRNIRRADRIVTISSFTAQMLVEHLGCQIGKIRVALLGVDHDLFHPVAVPLEFHVRFGLEPGWRYLLYVGSENPRKNLPRLIQAIEIVKRTIPNVKLIKVGMHDYAHSFERLKDQIHTAGLADNVLFVDHVSQEDLICFYSVADLFVFPSLYEGFGLPPLEAMACGAAVISSNASSLSEVVGDSAILVDPYDVDGWASAIIRVLEDEPLRLELKERGLARAGQFTWERTVRETISVYKELDSN
jgi:glycosyltransferase involved in cell wall biosynthesis